MDWESYSELDPGGGVHFSFIVSFGGWLVGFGWLGGEGVGE